MAFRHVTMRQLSVFEAAARLLSFSRAAEEMHLTQPGVSMQIRDIEASVGLPLFERVGRKLYLTDGGRELLVHARAILREVRQADATLDALKGLKGGRLTIAVVSTAKYFAPQLLARFRKAYPDVELHLGVNNREAVVDQLAGNAVDLAIMGQPPRLPESLAEPFAKHPLVIIAAPDHPLVRRHDIPVSAIANETFIVREPGSGTRSAMEHFFAEHGVAPRVGMEMPSNETIKQAVMAGMGIGFLSRHTVGLELEAKRLVVLDVCGLPVMRQWFVVHLAAKRLAPVALAFKAFVLEHGRPLLEAQFGVA